MMLFFEGRCTGCRTCEYICSGIKNRAFNPSRSAIKIEREGIVDRALFCNQCGDCIEVCPTEALYREDDIVRLNRESCSGCRLCVDACTIEGIFIDKIDGKAVKCDLCGECVKFCVTHALEV